MNGFHPQPKPRPIIEDRIAAKRERERRDLQFRLQVWLRDGGHCTYCDRRVVRGGSGDPAQRGEIHHLRGRNVAPEDRCNVEAAVLLCKVCHGRATRHEITVTR